MELPAWGWAAMSFSSLAGALMFAIIRPNPIWWRGVPSVLVSCGAGVALTPALCEWQAITSVFQHIFFAFMVGMLAMTASRSIVTVFEAESLSIAKKFIRRFFGLPDEPEPPKEDMNKE